MSFKEYTDFVNNNHLEGSTNSGIRLGLFAGDTLVACMGFRKNNLERFCSLIDTIVVGGFSKLLKYYVNTYQPEEVISFSDDRYSEGNLYRLNRFQCTRINSPRLFFTNGTTIRHRMYFQKRNLLNNYPKMKLDTEINMAKSVGFYPIFGCSTRKWLLKPV